MTNTGWILQAEGDLQGALAYYAQALPLHEKLGIKSGVALTLFNAGVAYTSLDRPRKGLLYLHRALALRSQSNERSARAGTLLEIGSAYRRLGAPTEAAYYFRRALNLARAVENRRLQAECLFRWASLDASEGRLLEALEKIETSLHDVEAARSHLVSDLLRASFLASKRDYYELYVDLLLRLDRRLPGLGYAKKALAASEMGRARSLVDLLASGRLNLVRGIDPDLKQKEADVTARLSQLQGLLIDKLSAMSPNEIEIASLQSRLDETVRERQKVERQIRRRCPRYAEARLPSPLACEEIQNSLPEAGVLLEYWFGREAAYLFVVAPDRVEVYNLPNPGRIAREVWTLREAIESRSRDSFSSYVRAARWLYQALVVPAEPTLLRKRHLVIAPDGPLHFLAFELLLTDEDGGREAAALPYLVREFSVSYTPSARVLRTLAKRRSPAKEVGIDGQAKRFVAYADPVYDVDDRTTGTADLDPAVRLEEDRSYKGWGLGRVRRLKGAAREVMSIAALYPVSEVQVYEGEEAKEENIKGNPLFVNARRVHFATHGVVNDRQPELSAIRLTRTSREDGLLQVHEIFNMQLNAELVVLSACNTGLGKEMTGEGLVGMTQAFLYAGTPSIIVSLWPVEDTQTPELMLRFYENLDRIGDKAEALRQAKLWMIGKGSYSARPFYWAPFILTGES